VGESGLGKNYLASAMANHANDQGMVVLVGRCLPFTRISPYYPWIDLVRGWFGLDEALSPLDCRQRLQESLARFDLTSSLPAFTDLLGIPTIHLSARASKSSRQEGVGLFDVIARETANQETDTENWTTFLSRSTVHEMISTRMNDDRSIWKVVRERVSIPQALHLLLKRQTLEGPTFVLIEDIQWMDYDSRAVLEMIMTSAHRWPLLFLATARPGVEWDGDRLILHPLSDTDTLDLASLGLHANRLAPDLASWFLSHSKGNPLFILSYCRALRDANVIVIDPATDEARWSGPPPSLPLSLQELLLAEVDRLGWGVQKTMQRSAVIGDSFSIQLLDHISSDVLSSTELDEALDQAARHSMITPPPPAPIYTFTSQSLHDAIYSTLSHAQRQIWHEELGDYLVRSDDITRYEQLEQIAYHYSYSDNAYKAAYFNRLAGDKARTRQADEAALTFYNQTLDVVKGRRVVVEQRRAHEGLGDVYALRDEAQVAYHHYQSALQNALPSDTLRLKAKLAMLLPLINSREKSMTPAEVLSHLNDACEALPSAHPLTPWLSSARIWVLAESTEVGAVDLKKELYRIDSKPVRMFLEEALASLDREKQWSSYDKLFDFFARAQLRYLIEEEN
jgi:adenylate cyclase